MGSSAFKPGLLLVVLLVPLSAASLCQFGKEYWSAEEGACVKCSRCEQPGHQVVLRPCQVHKDTVCGPLSSLPIQWPWKKKVHSHNKNSREQTETEDAAAAALTAEHRPPAHTHAHAHQHEKHHNRNEFNDPKHKPKPHHHQQPLALHQTEEDDANWPGDSLADVDQWERWLQKRLQHKKEDLLKNLLLEEKRTSLHHTFDDDDEDEDDESLSNEEDESTTHRPKHISKLDLEMFEKLVSHEQRNSRMSLEPSTVSEMVAQVARRRESEPFSAAETLVWDWQLVALISAVVACLLFFILAAIYSLMHVRQWRRLNHHLHLDVEDLALRVSLMNNGGLNSPNSDGGNTNHYLEQLLAVKKEGENMSNLYVEKQPKAS